MRFCWILSLPLVLADWHQEVFYQEVNRFRASPQAYQQEHNLPVRCSAPLGETYAPLQPHPLLENSSHFQASTMSSFDCPVVSHETCPSYCGPFGGCSFLTRIAWFLHDTPYHNPLEVLIMGPKNPYKIFAHFLNSPPHCDHILSTHINAMGCGFVHTDRNLFVADLAWIG